MNPRHVLSEMRFVGVEGVGLGSRARLAWDCLAARLPLVWSQTRQSRHRVRLRIQGRTRTVHLRNNGSDVRILLSILKDREYDVPGMDWRSVGSILDAGANIGITSLYLAARAPGARIVAVEPEPSNLRLLETNLAENHVAAEIVPAALWSSPGRMTLHVSGSAMAHALNGSGDASQSRIEVDTIDMPALLRRFGGAIDLVKLDVEGAERAIFASPQEWIRSVRMYVIECHPEQGLDSRRLGAILTRSGFDARVYNVKYDLLFALRR